MYVKWKAFEIMQIKRHFMRHEKLTSKKILIKLRKANLESKPTHQFNSTPLQATPLALFSMQSLLIKFYVCFSSCFCFCCSCYSNLEVECMTAYPALSACKDACEESSAWSTESSVNSKGAPGGGGRGKSRKRGCRCSRHSTKANEQWSSKRRRRQLTNHHK